MKSLSLRAGVLALLSVALWAGSIQAQSPGVVRVFVPQGIGPSRGMAYFVGGELQRRHPQGEYREYSHDGQGVQFRFHDGTFRRDGSVRYGSYGPVRRGTHSFGVSPAGRLYMYRGEPQPQSLNQGTGAGAPVVNGRR